MIGGYILDAGAIRQLVLGRPFMVARLVVSVEQIQVLYVPTTALAAGLIGHDISPRRREQVDLALAAPVFEFHRLDRPAALAVAELATMAQVDLATAHAGHLALRRPGWPVITDRPAELHKMHPGIETVELP
ncbi:hypothetical protein [Streptomyces chryseus]|uniref:PIN domain-containing protein n=1 Tax=Streptomyces chryseus TaxID=68186 RepID=A0ABQ3DIX9_9ACTN|nr:hypothetical protein [Streptomyces chryseus]GGX14210.1 hypothetical protein GCM10010353_31830 [Streptomyces chryseus]GHA97266.1 hypothetical protein GCM10010346_20050 [Streptomyces chryseus]